MPRQLNLRMQNSILSFCALALQVLPAIGDTSSNASLPTNDKLNVSQFSIFSPLFNVGEVEFLLYNNEDLTSPYRSHVDDSGIMFGGALNKSLETKIVIHGWLNSYKAPIEQHIVKAYLPKFNYNVIGVNWAGAEDLLYIVARYRVEDVGKMVAQFVDRIVAENGLNVSSIHLIGHSLGAHIVGVAGRNVKSGRISKITGLDPALPLFFKGGKDTLSKQDADFVEVVHSCMGIVGMISDIGHIDFYPNGGLPFQPGCSVDLVCSHGRSFEYYAESIVKPTAFLGTYCESLLAYELGQCDNNIKLYMNGNISTSERGSYYMKTRSSSPYGLGVNS